MPHLVQTGPELLYFLGCPPLPRLAVMTGTNEK
jgi:hypothetical protein